MFLLRRQGGLIVDPLEVWHLRRFIAPLIAAVLARLVLQLIEAQWCNDSVNPLNT
jgi:hypothetical protein